MKIFYYVSGHGFGHASRVCEIVNIIYKKYPSLDLRLKSTAPKWFFDWGLLMDYSYEYLSTDVGVMQNDCRFSLIESTLKTYEDFIKKEDKIIKNQVDSIELEKPDLIISDSSSLVMEISDKAGIPGIFIGNFTWSWIYSDYVKKFPEYDYIVGHISGQYRKADIAFRLPFHNAFTEFENFQDTPLVARMSKIDPQIIRSGLSIPGEKPVVLITFGGFPAEGINKDSLADRNKDFYLVTTGTAGVENKNIRIISDSELTENNIQFYDFLNACDCIVSKPGYGIVSDCIANNTPLIYTSREDFKEYDLLVDGISCHLKNAFIPKEDFIEGKWSSYIYEALEYKEKLKQIDITGAEFIAENLHGYI